MVYALELCLHPAEYISVSLVKNGRLLVVQTDKMGYPNYNIMKLNFQDMLKETRRQKDVIASRLSELVRLPFTSVNVDDHLLFFFLGITS